MSDKNTSGAFLLGLFVCLGLLGLPRLGLRIELAEGGFSCRASGQDEPLVQTAARIFG